MAPPATVRSTELVPVDQLHQFPGNPRNGDVELIAESLRTHGQYRALVVNTRGGKYTILAGNHTYQGLLAIGATEALCHLVDLDEDAAKRVVLVDNRANDVSAHRYDDGLLAGLLQSLPDLAGTGYGDDDLAALLAELAPEPAPTPAHNDPDMVPEAPVSPISKPGDLWRLGHHRLLCGDSTVASDVARLFAGAEAECILTDPPYCSGGFQEAGRHEGSIGTNARIKRSIANDKLSTRGYIALLKSVFSLAPARMAYVFTDWRMWVNLFDVVESSGFGVRNMVVWDKGTPGMGCGWRTQHELVMFCSRDSVKFDNHKAQGNVVASKRTGNPLHPTQKPVDLLVSILAVTDMAPTIYDPFAGSGTTLIAAHTAGRQAYLMDLEPVFTDVVCRRFQEHTGVVPVLDATGEERDFTAPKR